jgi:hypothetical protein
MVKKRLPILDCSEHLTGFNSKEIGKFDDASQIVIWAFHGFEAPKDTY